MIFSFTRLQYINTTFQDIGLHMSDCVKYDIYESENLVGTLITDERKTFEKFQSGKIYRRSKKTNAFQFGQYILKDEFEKVFSTIRIVSPLFRPDEIELVFDEDASKYVLLNKNVARNAGPFNIIIDIWNANKSVFSLHDHEHGNHGAQDETRPMGGTIEISDELDKEKIFGFLYATQVYLWNLRRD